MIGAVLCSTVMSQQCAQQWTEHRALSSAGVQCGGVGGGVADLPGRKSRIQLQREVFSGFIIPELLFDVEC